MIKIIPPLLIICHSQTKRQGGRCLQRLKTGYSKYEESVYNYPDMDNCLEAKQSYTGKCWNVTDWDGKRGNTRSCEQYLVLVVLRGLWEKAPYWHENGAYRSAPWRPKESGRSREVLPNHAQLSSAGLRHHSSPASKSVCLQIWEMNILQHEKSILVLILCCLSIFVRWGCWDAENEKVTGYSLS